MHEGAFGILITALLVIPTCLGLWREGSTNRQGILKVLERRKTDRRKSKRAMHDPRANYHYLGSIHPTQASTNTTRESQDRRGSERRTVNWRFEDTAYQSAPLLSRHAGIRVFAPRITQDEIDLNMPALKTSRLRVKHSSSANF